MRSNSGLGPSLVRDPVVAPCEEGDGKEHRWHQDGPEPTPKPSAQLLPYSCNDCQCSLILKCSQMIGLQVLKSRYDPLEKVKPFEELREISPGRPRAISVLHPQDPYPGSAGPCFHSQASATRPSPWTPGLSLSWDEVPTTTYLLLLPASS